MSRPLAVKGVQVHMATAAMGAWGEFELSTSVLLEPQIRAPAQNSLVFHCRPCQLSILLLHIVPHKIKVRWSLLAPLPLQTLPIRQLLLTCGAQISRSLALKPVSLVPLL